MTALAEADVKEVAPEWLDALGWQTAHGPDHRQSRASPEKRPIRRHVPFGRGVRSATHGEPSETWPTNSYSAKSHTSG